MVEGVYIHIFVYINTPSSSWMRSVSMGSLIASSASQSCTHTRTSTHQILDHQAMHRFVVDDSRRGTRLAMPPAGLVQVNPSTLTHVLAIAHGL